MYISCYYSILLLITISPKRINVAFSNVIEATLGIKLSAIITLQLKLKINYFLFLLTYQVNVMSKVTLGVPFDIFSIY